MLAGAGVVARTGLLGAAAADAAGAGNGRGPAASEDGGDWPASVTAAPSGEAVCTCHDREGSEDLAGGLGVQLPESHCLSPTLTPPAAFFCFFLLPFACAMTLRRVPEEHGQASPS